MKKLLKSMGFDDLKYYEIKEYLNINNYKIKDITKIEKYDDWYCILYINNERIGII